MLPQYIIPNQLLLQGGSEWPFRRLDGQRLLAAGTGELLPEPNLYHSPPGAHPQTQYFPTVT